MYLKIIRRNKKLNNEKGFTLVEVLAAVTLMAVSLLFIVQLLSYSMKYNSESGNITIANNLAQDKIEEYRNNSYSTGEAISVVSGYPNFKRSVEVTSNSPTTDTDTIKVTVTWIPKSGNTNSVVLQTVKLK